MPLNLIFPPGSLDPQNPVYIFNAHGHLPLGLKSRVNHHHPLHCLHLLSVMWMCYIFSRLHDVLLSLPFSAPSFLCIICWVLSLISNNVLPLYYSLTQLDKYYISVSATPCVHPYCSNDGTNLEFSIISSVTLSRLRKGTLILFYSTTAVVLQNPWWTGNNTATIPKMDIKICGCSSSLYKILSYLHIT